MPTYTVHASPKDADAAPEGFLFVRDGFHFWAFVAPSLWLLVMRLWLALAIYLVLGLAFIGALVWLTVGTAAIVAAGLCLSLLIGFEAATIRRWTLVRRGWTTLGFVVGEDADEAERRFFVRWAERPVPAQAEPAVPPAPVRRPATGVIGLFPEPGSAR